MVTERESGLYEFRIHLPGARRVAVVGDFTRWEAGAIEMRRGPDGWWTRTLKLAPGDHRFSYLVNGTDWYPDYASDGVEPDRGGGWISCVNVRGRAAASCSEG